MEYLDFGFYPFFNKIENNGYFLSSGPNLDFLDRACNVSEQTRSLSCSLSRYLHHSLFLTLLYFVKERK